VAPVTGCGAGQGLSVGKKGIAARLVTDPTVSGTEALVAVNMGSMGFKTRHRDGRKQVRLGTVGMTAHAVRAVKMDSAVIRVGMIIRAGVTYLTNAIIDIIAIRIGAFAIICRKDNRFWADGRGVYFAFHESLVGAVTAISVVTNGAIGNMVILGMTGRRCNGNDSENC
jgi:hypothetical protein